jgi:hypothetical protein
VLTADATRLRVLETPLRIWDLLETRALCKILRQQMPAVLTPMPN